MVSVSLAWVSMLVVAFWDGDRLLCSFVHSLQLTKGEFIVGAITELIPCNMVSFVCVNPSLADQSLIS